MLSCAIGRPPERDAEGRRGVTLYHRSGGASFDGYRAMNNRSRSVLSLSTNTLPEQRLSRPSRLRDTSALRLRLPFNGRRSDRYAAGCQLVLPKEVLPAASLSRVPRDSYDRC